MKVFTFFVSISLLAFHTTMACTFENENVYYSHSSSSESGLKILNLKSFIDSLGYPWALKSKGIEGKVLLRLEVDASGTLVSHTVIHATSEQFAELCISKLEKLKFQPAKDENGKGKDCSVLLPIRFEMDIS